MRHHLRPAIGAIVVVALAASGATLVRAATVSDAPTAAALAARNESLRRELELAEGDAFYLLLDPEASVLTLMYKGAPLRETRILSAEIGEPRARGRGDDGAPFRLDALWTGGSLEPPRIDVREEVVPPPIAGAAAPDANAAALAAPAPQGEFLEGGEDAEAGAQAPTPEPVVEEVEIPKTPEELYPVPSAYEIRFAEGLTLEVVRARTPAAAPQPDPAGKIKSAADGEAAQYPTAPGPTLWERIRRFARQAMLARPEGERARMRIVIDPLDADRLFRSLPPDVKLLVRVGSDHAA
jgi:hypothetical protein